MNTNTSANPNVYPATDSQTSTPSGSPLQRGKACLSCRRRKMKCDSARPVCTPCLRGERAEDCEYTDGPRRPRTLTLEEDIARLKARVQELENPDAAMPSVELSAPYADAGAASAFVGQAHVQAPSPIPCHHPPGMGQGLSHESPSARSLQMDFEGRALSVIASHTAEIGFFLNLDRLRVQGTHVLPALQTALTLWSVHITTTCDPDQHAPERIQALQCTLLSRAQNQLASALSTVDAEPDPAVFLHVIQTGVLLSYYMQRIGRVVGARYYASGTWMLVMTLKLYRRPHLSGGAREDEGEATRVDGVREGSTHANTNMLSLSFVGCGWSPPALDEIEAEERVRAFWAAYALDRWFGVVCEIPHQSLVLDGSSGIVMTVPWPGMGTHLETRSNVVERFLNDPSHDFTQDGASAMHAKASVLLGEATRMAASFVADHTISQSAAFRARFGTLDALLQRCLSAAMTLATVSHGHPSQTQEQAQARVTVHLIALAHVTLHRPFIATHGPSRRRSVEGALGVVRILDQLGEVWGKVGGMSPIYPIVWTALCLALHNAVLHLRARLDGDPSRRHEGEVMGAIRKLVSVLSALSQGSPTRFFAANIEAVLPILGSIAV